MNSQFHLKSVFIQNNKRFLTIHQNWQSDCCYFSLSQGAIHELEILEKRAKTNENEQKLNIRQKSCFDIFTFY